MLEIEIKKGAILSTLILECRILEVLSILNFIYTYGDKDTQAYRRHQKIRRYSLDEKRVR